MLERKKYRNAEKKSKIDRQKETKTEKNERKQ